MGLVSLIELTSYNEALQDKELIMEMEKELDQFEKNDVWDLVPKPKGTHVIGTKEAGERLHDRLAREAEAKTCREAEEKARLEEEESAREVAEKAAAEAVAVVEAEAKAKADAEKAARIATEEAGKARYTALTQGEKSHSDFAPLVLKTLEELQKEQQIMRARLDQQDSVNSNIQKLLTQLLQRMPPPPNP
ncbi:uncharacterized protein LOC127122177 [Lathyrus oleraceus]|uniref:uncharacterized protein LOC127122177 n=1 Tax=Pisum sativum TaxID=3888 RepID=UPI0021D3DEEE|nr:uncharacterized protein LOC127122177 [Pisum sativum]